MRTKRAILNVISNLTFQIITVIVGLLIPRLLITTYGSSINGLILSIRQFINYLSIVEAGVGQASMVALYKPLSLNDNNKINGILSATNIFYRKSGYLFALLVGVLAIVYPFFVKDDVDPQLALLMVLILGIGGIWEFFLVGKYSVLLRADQKSYIIFRIDSVLIIVSTVVSIILINLGVSILIVMSSLTMIMLLNIFFLKLYVRIYYPSFNIRVTPDTGAIKSKWDALIHQIAGLVVFNTPLIIITIFTNLQEASVYAVYSMVFSAITLIISTFSNAAIAAFGDLLVSGELSTIQKQFNNFEYVFFAIVAFFYTTSSILIIPFIEIYTVNVTDADYIRPMLATFFVIVGIANALRIPATTLVISAGHFKETKSRAIIEAIINLITSIIFVQFFGIEGVLLAGICSYAYRTIDLILYSSKKILHRPSTTTLNHIIRNLLLSSISAFSFLLFIELNIVSFLSWIIYGFILSIWIFAIIFLGNFVLKPSIMGQIYKQLKGLVNYGR